MAIHDHKKRWRTLTAIALGTAILVNVWQFSTWTRNRSGPSANTMMVIAPYAYHGTWVLDDPDAGLKREPFAASPFPGFQKKLTSLRGDSGGNCYKLDDPPMGGSICPALFRYYTTAPSALYIKAEPRQRRG